MLTREELIKNADIQKIAQEGEEIYNGIKTQYEPQDNGKFLAIDITSRHAYRGETSTEAVESAKKDHPDTVFYVVKIGYSVAEALADMSLYAYRPD